MSGAYSIVAGEQAEDAYAGTDVPGQFRRLTKALGCAQLALTLTMRFGDDVHEVAAGTAVRVGPGTVRSHRNRGEDPVEMWVFSRKDEGGDATKVDDFWEASPEAAQTR